MLNGTLEVFSDWSVSFYDGEGSERASFLEANIIGCLVAALDAEHDYFVTPFPCLRDH